MKLKYVDKDQRRSFGGWGAYMDFAEVLNDSGEVVAKVSEELGTIWTPQCLEVLHDENNMAQSCELVEYNDEYIVVESQGELYAYPIVDLSEQLRERMEAFNIPTLCRRADVNYANFRKWKSSGKGITKLAIARLVYQMDLA